jgi:hypothetical protein
MANFLGEFRATGRARNDVLDDIGNALGQVKRNRGLTADDMRIVFGLKVDDQVARYMAGEAEMGIIAWMRACEAWPELLEFLEETTNERVLRGRQRALDLELPLEVLQLTFVAGAIAGMIFEALLITVPKLAFAILGSVL